MKKLLYAAILGALLWILSEILELTSLQGLTPWSLWMTSIWHPVLALGFWGLHKSQSPNKNILSLIGVILLILSFIGFAPVSLIILHSEVNTFSEFLKQNPMFQIFGLFSVLGYLLFGIAMIRTKYFPGWMGYALIIALALSVIQTFGRLPELLQHIAFIGLSAVLIIMSVFSLT